MQQCCSFSGSIIRGKEILGHYAMITSYPCSHAFRYVRTTMRAVQIKQNSILHHRQLRKSHHIPSTTSKVVLFFSRFLRHRLRNKDFFTIIIADKCPSDQTFLLTNSQGMHPPPAFNIPLIFRPWPERQTKPPMLVCSTTPPKQIPRRALLGLLFSLPILQTTSSEAANVPQTAEEWREVLTPVQFAILRLGATEHSYSSPLNYENRKGTFVCAACSNPLYSSSTKFESGTGWPSFSAVLPHGVVERLTFKDILFQGKSINCLVCAGHIGHVFSDGPQPTGLRYCMNGFALRFIPG